MNFLKFLKIKILKTHFECPDCHKAVHNSWKRDYLTACVSCYVDDVLSDKIDALRHDQKRVVKGSSQFDV